MSSSPTPELLDKLAERLGPHLLRRDAFRGEATVVVAPQAWLETCRFLKEDPELAFGLLVDLTVVDLQGLGGSPGFEVVAHLYSIRKRHRIRLKTPVPEDQAQVPSLTPLWKNANWLEREAWDMFGVRFLGHPELRRILLYPEFEGHPLRRDYPLRKRQPLVAERDVEEPRSMVSEPVRYPVDPRFKTFGV